MNVENVVVAPDGGAAIQVVQNVQNDNELSNSSTFPDSMFEKLPVFLQETCSKFDNKRERDVFFLGSLAVLSACFNDVSGVYDNHKLHPHFFGFVIAPPASGKGVLTFAKLLGMAIHDKAKNEKNDNFIDEFKKMILEVELDEKQPIKADSPALFMPANISSAAMFQALSESGGTGLIFETEADAMVNALNQGWGDYSNILRNAFHHEPISYRRKTKNVLIEIDSLRIAAILSGTPSQAASLIKSAENGLFSRFAIYNYKGSIVWRDVSPKDGVNLTEYFCRVSEQVLEMHEFMQANPAEFYLSPMQWGLLNSHFEKHLKKVSNLGERGCR